MVSRNIFRQYDIRGNVERELTEEVVTGIARAFAVYADRAGYRQVLIGRDNRKSSPRFRDLVVETLMASGCEVVDLGVVITPMFYFAARHLGLKAGMMITASHNPGEDNGFKILLGESTIYGEEIQELYRMVERKESMEAAGGSVRQVDIAPDYFAMIKSRIQLGPRKLKVGIDCGNGTASLFAPQLFRELGCEVVELYCESDPDFPNHHPDPVKVENCQDLIKVVQAEDADLGLGFDGDGDRLGVVDREGNIIWGDMLMILFWREILPRYPGSECIVEVKCSQALIDEIERLGGRPVIYKTGHSLIKAKMKEMDAVFTGRCRVICFSPMNITDMMMRCMRYGPAAAYTEQQRTDYNRDAGQCTGLLRYPELRVKSTDEEKFRVVNQVLEHFQSRYEVIDVDGAGSF